MLYKLTKGITKTTRRASFAVSDIASTVGKATRRVASSFVAGYRAGVRETPKNRTIELDLR